MSETVIITRTYEIHPNKQMQKILDRNMDFRRHCWNHALEIWNDMYAARDLMLEKSKRLMIAEYYQIKASLNSNRKMKPKTIQKKQRRMTEICSQLTNTDWELAQNNPSPTWRRVRDVMVQDKTYEDQHYSSRILQLAVQDLGQSFQAFFEKVQARQGLPKYKSCKAFRQGFKTDQAKIVNGKIKLDQPRLVKVKWPAITLPEHPLSESFGVVSFYRERGKYYVTIPFKVLVNDLNQYDKTGHNGAIDRNVGRFVSPDGAINVYPKRLERLYSRVKYYQRLLAKKREVNGKHKAVRSRNYQKIRRKLQLTYLKIRNIQHDLMHKFTLSLIKQYDKIVIEDLNVSAMKMSHIASKGLQRSMFGLFARLLTYKCNYYHRQLILANQFYPSTQRCSYCGMIKRGEDKVTLRGNKKHNTRHNEYVCYNPDCGMYNKIQDRDQNAARNLLELIDYPELNKRL